MGREPDPLEHEGESEESPSFADAVAAAARRSGLGHVKPGEAPSARALLAAVGGIRGLVESILPPLLFLVVYTVTQQLAPSVLAPLGIAVVFIVVRIVMRQPVMTAVVGALGVGVSAGLALLSGRASDNFLPGLIINVALLLVMLVSLAVRRPLIGVMVGLLTGDGFKAQKDFVLKDVAVLVNDNKSESAIWLGPRFVETYFTDGVYGCASDGTWRLHGRVKAEFLEDIKTRTPPKKP